jgi:hypothetical protein
MSRQQKSRGVGKGHKNQVTHDSVPLAKKTFRKPQEPEGRIANIDFSKNTWSAKMAAAWAGVPERTLYRMLRDGLLPCIPMGETQVQKLSTAKSGKRVRKCYRFVIPRVAFMKAWENIGSAASMGNTAA